MDGFFLLKMGSPEYSAARSAEIACLTWLRDNDSLESMFAEHGGFKETFLTRPSGASSKRSSDLLGMGIHYETCTSRRNRNNVQYNHVHGDGLRINPLKVMMTIEYMNFTCESDLNGPNSSELPPFEELILRCPRALVEEVACPTRITYSNGTLISLEVWLSSTLYTAAAGRVLPYYPGCD